MTQDERWLHQWQTIMDFMEANKRRPSKFVDEERRMRNWWKHQQKLLNAGELKTNCRGKGWCLGIGLFLFFSLENLIFTEIRAAIVYSLVDSCKALVDYLIFCIFATEMYSSELWSSVINKRI